MFTLGAAALLLSSGFQLAVPLVLRSAVDSLTGGQPLAVLGGQAQTLAALALAQALAKFVSRRIFLGGARQVEHDLRGAYFRHLIRLPAARIEAGRRGDFVSRATNDLQDLRLFLGPGALNFLQTAVLLVCATVLLWRIHPGLTLASLAPFPAISLLVRRYSPELHRRYRAANARTGDLAARVQETLAGFRVVQAYQRQQWAVERFEAMNREAGDAQLGVIRISALLFPFVSVVAGAGHITVLGLGGYWVARGSLTLGEFVAFNTYLAMLTWPMIALGWTLSLVQRGAAAMSRLREVMDIPVDCQGDRPLPESGGPCLEARGLRFRYGADGNEVLAGVDLALPRGAYCGLVGRTGSGKSTLVALLAGARRPTGGAILAHGVPLAELAAPALRAHLAVVPQGGALFADTVAENVLLGRAPDPARLAWALEAASLAAEVAAMPHGVETRVGEGGVTLSGGQRQRLAIARALYGHPETLLLDSALSSLDTDTARRVLAAVRRALPGCTILVVSHRGTEVDAADTVFFLDGGRIAAEGRHAELLGGVPAYLALYREEQLRRELDEAAA